MGISGGGLDLKNTVLNGEEGHIEGTSTKIEDKHVLLNSSFLIQSVRNSGSGRLIDDSQHVQTGDHSGILSSLSLGVVEVSGHSDNSVFHGLGEESLGSLSHFDEHHSTNFFGVEFFDLSLVLNHQHRLAITISLHFERPQLSVLLNNRVVEFSSNQTLGVENSIHRVSSYLILSSISDQSLVFSETHI